MRDLIIGSEVSVLGGESLNLDLAKIKNDITSLKATHNLREFSLWVQLGFSGPVDLATLCNRLPRWATFRINCYVASEGAIVGLPYINSGSPAYITGVLTVYKANDYTKAYIEYKDDNGTVFAATYKGSPGTVTPWMVVGQSTLFFTPTAANFGNLISNIWVPGDYYFTAAEMAKFTDAPSSAGCFIKVENPSRVIAGDKLYTVTRNGDISWKWHKIGTGAWRNIPINYPSLVDATWLRIGDSMIGNDGVMLIRVSASLVGKMTIT